MKSLTYTDYLKISNSLYSIGSMDGAQVLVHYVYSYSIELTLLGALSVIKSSTKIENFLLSSFFTFEQGKKRVGIVFRIENSEKYFAIIKDSFFKPFRNLLFGSFQTFRKFQDHQSVLLAKIYKNTLEIFTKY